MNGGNQFCKNTGKSKIFVDFTCKNICEHQLRKNQLRILEK